MTNIVEYDKISAVLIGGQLIRIKKGTFEKGRPGATPWQDELCYRFTSADGYQYVGLFSDVQGVRYGWPEGVKE